MDVRDVPASITQPVCSFKTRNSDFWLLQYHSKSPVRLFWTFVHFPARDSTHAAITMPFSHRFDMYQDILAARPLKPVLYPDALLWLGFEHYPIMLLREPHYIGRCVSSPAVPVSTSFVSFASVTGGASSAPPFVEFFCSVGA
jgi:hypothetical protein